MAVETALSFLRGLTRGGTIPAVCLVCGPQAFLREYVADAIRARHIAEGRQRRSFQVGVGDDFGATLSELRAPDLFAQKKLVWCRVLPARKRGGEEGSSERPRRGGADESALAEAIESIGGPTALLLLYERDAAPAKIRSAVERAGLLVNCLRPFDDQLEQYAQLFARALDLGLSAEAADLLVSRCATDLSAYANALARAALYCEKGKRLTPADLLEPGGARVPEPFDLAESIARGNAALALGILDRSLAIGRDPVELLSVEIIPVMRRMMVVAAMLKRRKSAAEIAVALGLRPTSNLAMRAIEGARRFGLERLTRAYQSACELDARFKMGIRREREAALSEFLVELAAP